MEEKKRIEVPETSTTLLRDVADSRNVVTPHVDNNAMPPCVRWWMRINNSLSWLLITACVTWASFCGYATYAVDNKFDRYSVTILATLIMQLTLIISWWKVTRKMVHARYWWFWVPHFVLSALVFVTSIVLYVTACCDDCYKHHHVGGIVGNFLWFLAVHMLLPNENIVSCILFSRKEFRTWMCLRGTSHQKVIEIVKGILTFIGTILCHGLTLYGALVVLMAIVLKGCNHSGTSTDDNGIEMIQRGSSDAVPEPES